MTVVEEEISFLSLLGEYAKIQLARFCVLMADQCIAGEFCLLLLLLLCACVRACARACVLYSCSSFMLKVSTYSLFIWN